MKNLPTQYQQYIHLSRYSRWLDDKKRRETWEETVARYFDFFQENLSEVNGYEVSPEIRKELEDAVLNLEIMPSMRCLMTAGKALKKDNVAGYNCSYTAIDRVRAFDEILYVLMCGTGVGFSVERQHVSKLPVVPDEIYDTDTVIVVADSKLGWAKSYKEFVNLLYSGAHPKTDTSRVRKAGEPLKTFGGRASGPEPLEDLFTFTYEVFMKARGRKLSSLECHDLVCKIAEIVVVGGVRRSALISLSNLSDDRMRNAKNGNWWDTETQRTLANNSVAYTEKPEIGSFMEEWLSLYNSKSGERGIFNRVAAQRQAGRFDRRDPNYDFGVNPCGEILLRNAEFCNLTEVVVREDDDIKSLARKVRLASILGTWQSTLISFRYLGRAWTNNCKEERLLGVSLTGIMDNDLTNGNGGLDTLSGTLEKLRDYAIETNTEWANELGIEASAAVTCVKPSGTVSQMVNSGSGIHSRHSPYYLRSVRADLKDPLAQLMIEEGFPWEPDLTQPLHTGVFYFPIKSPDDSVCRKDRTAIEQLELWLVYKEHWCEHNPSVTISVHEHEWLEVGAWVYEHFQDIGGVSFLPFSEHSYKQAPYQDLDEDSFEEWLVKIPENVDWTKLSNYENSDVTTSSQELACVAGGCEI